MSNKYRDKATGKFSKSFDEPLTKRLVGARLPLSMERKLRQVAGDDLSAWIREAIAEKLEREQQEISA